MMADPAKPEIEEARRARGRPKATELADLEARLMRVARRNFFAKGYGGASMNEIAYGARVSKGTLYARFPSKADLFRTMIEAHIKEAGEVARPATPRPSTLEAALHLYAERGLRFNLSEKHVGLNRLMFGEAGRFPELAQALAVRAKAGIDDLADMIGEYAEYEKIPCRDPVAAAEMFLTLLRGFYVSVMHQERAARLAEIRGWTEVTVKLFLAGRATW